MIEMDENEYIVSRIAGMKIINKTRYYLIEWEGYDLVENTWERENNVYSPHSISKFIEDYCKESRCRRDLVPYINRKILLQNTYDPDTKQHYKPIKNVEQITTVTTDAKDKKRVRDTPDCELENSSRAVQDIRKSFRPLLLDAPKEFQDTFNFVINSVKINFPVVRAQNHQRINNVPLYVVKNLKARVTIYNDIDSDLPNDFIYTDQLLYTAPVQQPDPNFLSGCNCSGSDDCSSGCHDTVVYDNKGRLAVKQGTAIYECNNACECSRNCKNRVVQRGRSIPLQIFKTSKKGWGVRTTQTIPKGTFIEEYIGEVITTEECDKRGSFYDEHGCSYLFDMDFAQGELPTKYAIDAFIMGNVSRFFNHSCSPNLEVFAVYYDSADVQMHRLAFFASRDIKKNEELCFDYNGREDLQQIEDEEENPARYSCHCDSNECRKWIYM
ncbi:hypothetical protein G6F57_010015 [Rhizopus arrhizus]|uniref:Histone-lysine N-methyltransferase n=1 Tax=Rhizopus oryzae TaxID=64495 RepID=A0A9P7BN44_RHIOR|nr:hypothetical protein G6F23_007169 [Rhizopus arrhizus]KAG1411530.1 hypothetical protein G6F58_008507 [Rhizopus delemar]KAG0757055.1 hypothetical protein G6F24_010740 [Rhizopus arrhizus]KAG0783342.1 hypothetical protein G6F21_010593 [Rhizopus arrhizus]KAG0799284.1 hypothetical protein G6F22_003381 [Rhizopus arrhizus]